MAVDIKHSDNHMTQKYQDFTLLPVELYFCFQNLLLCHKSVVPIGCHATFNLP